MRDREWPAEDYATGSYIQSTVSDNFLPQLQFNPTDKVLDIGCGTASYTQKILNKVPQGSVLGIDTSENMLALAKKISTDYPNFLAKKDDVVTMTFKAEFDQIISFWCLQWASDINKAFINIVNALKAGGKFFTLFPAGDDPYILTYYAIRDSKLFPCLTNFKPPVDYSKLHNLAEKLKDIACKKLNVILHRATITLPSLDTYRKFVEGIAFYQGQLSDGEVKQINKAMVAWYEKECQKNWRGEHQFNFTLYLVRGEK